MQNNNSQEYLIIQLNIIWRHEQIENLSFSDRANQWR